MPQGIAVDSSGNIYVADTVNCTIRKILPSGLVTTLAGTALNEGSANGVGASAQFLGPESVTVDSAGNVYVADSLNDTIRKITPSGIVTTLAGTARTPGSANGTGTAAQFYQPEGVAADSVGNVYVTDSLNFTIRKITPSGVVTTFAGTPGKAGTADGTSASAQFGFPQGITIDGSNNVYVTDAGLIRKITPSGVVTTLCSFAASSIAVDGAGNLYVANTGGQTISKIAPSGMVTTLAGVSGAAGVADGVGDLARFNFSLGPGLVVDSSGYIYVADSGNSLIRKVTQAGSVTTLAGKAGSLGSEDGTGTAAEFDYPLGLGVDNFGNIYVADSFNSTIRKITPSGIVTTLAGKAGVMGSSDGTGPEAEFGRPTAVAVDNFGNVYVNDSPSIRKITPSGAVTTVATGGPLDYLMAGIAVDNSGNIYVPIFIPADVPVIPFTMPQGTGQILKVTPTGVITNLADIPTGIPYGVAVDSLGNVYVTDNGSVALGNGTILKIAPSGTTTTIAGAQIQGAAAQLVAPEFLAVDNSDNVYVVDSVSSIRKVTASGVVTTLAGTIAGPGSSYCWPTGVAVGGGGLYISDCMNNAVWQGVATGALPTIATSPMSQTVTVGSSVTFVAASGTAATYQWQFDGTDISGATGSTLTLANVGTTQAGSYTVIVSNAYGSVTSSAATLTANVAAHLYNISSRAYVGAGPNQNIVAGFYTDGSGSKNVVVRGIGPDLAVVDPALSDQTLQRPELTLFNGSAAILATNTGWGDSQALINAFASVYAAPLQAGSNDTAVFMSVPAASGVGYTAEVNGLNNGTGIALVEVYDYDSYTSTPTSHLINLSTRAFVGSGSQSLVAGFWIIGSSSQTVLIRAVGPGLAAGDPALSGQTLTKPTLTLYDSSDNVVASNAGWSNAPVQGSSTVAAGILPATAAIMSEVYASTLNTGSTDCAMVVTLPPGGYTAQVSSADSTTGVALVEVYNIP
jgi:sugar lactone lactonase YvrE